MQKVQRSVDKALSMKPKPRGFCAVVTLDVKNAFNTANWNTCTKLLIGDYLYT